ncbi:undecaprenyl-diphosphate phosphatase [bacterium]|nr:undecaprenyl-diphosphate phosphatase [bacterium]
METIKTLIIAIVQGLTELLPVSSSGHILLVGKLMSMDITSDFLILFHLGTTIALIVYYRHVLFDDLFTKEKLQMYLKIVVSCIPAGVLGLLFDDIISEKLRATWIMALSLIVWGIVMIILERNTHVKKIKTKDIRRISWKQSIAMGCAQCIALIPGTSRSGITTIAGILMNLDKYLAFQYAMLLGLPVLLGSFVWSCFKGIVLHEEGELASVSLPIFVMIFAVTFILGYLSLHILSKVKKEKWLTFFGVYRIILGILILLFVK